ncbi:glycogen debranching enzyme GlgX [Butyrivibrio sp. X503]|uniref:glycogen debranching protein GlgX n=1 Tax=Butyrivibrio sp. X503 TaxID=2364878 RepID=UPI000EA99A14|nr:glycogen debranching protein GlgX [Butyrivibrio sp. X503]RKM54064.1 glycogen debranching enzyme GlgX [Butyrivibrio sp. X503]
MSEYRRHRSGKKKIDVESHRAEILAKDDINRQLVWLDEVNGYKIRPGVYSMYGATMLNDSIINFTVYSNGATSITLLLYKRGDKNAFAEIPFPESYKIGKVYSMIVFGLDIENLEYNYRVDGPWEPEKGLLFDKKNTLLDPFAKAVSGQRIWGEKSYGEDEYRARVVRNYFEWNVTRNPEIPMCDSIIYEMHVRGFTKDKSSGVTHGGTFEGIKEKADYLKKLGITAVELMPIFEFDETRDMREHNGRTLLDYWGYNTIAFFAPNTSYACEAEHNNEGLELKQMINALKANGIEVILDVVFNHTAEGNEHGPFISFKGFDNNIYYLLTPHGEYYNFSGCGNTMNCNHPMVQEFIVQCLRYWVEEYRVDGFRFDLASILGRDQDGAPMDRPPLLQRIAYDPILGDVKLIAEAWDAGGVYQVGNFPSWKRWAEWNGKYRDDIRSYLKGDIWAAPEAVKRITGSMDMYGGSYLGYESSVNFITCHDGFTLYDLYSYNSKHNEENGWNNTDGANDNRSWNCGAEGDTDDPGILDLRFRMMRNAITVLMCSRGTPMLYAGDEFGNTQFGNNNAYCQDNEISWLDWSLIEKNRDYYDYYRNIIQFRRKHPCIRKDLEPAKCGLPFISVHTENPDNGNITKDSRVICIRYAGYYDKKGHDDIVYIAINAYWEDIQIMLPGAPAGSYWTLCADTGDDEGKYYNNRPKPLAFRNKTLKARSVSVFTVAYGAEYG